MTDPERAGNLPLKIVVLALVSAGVGFLAAGKAGLGAVPGCVIGVTVFSIGLLAVLRLSGVPRELWFTFGLKFFSVTAYKIVTVVLVSYLIKDCGLSDSRAQWLFGIWGMFMSVSTVLSGSITDALGLRRTLLLGVTLCLVTRLIMLVSTNSGIVLLCGLIPLAAGEALCTPVLVAATRKFTSASQRSVAFSVFYSILNVGFMAAYFVRDGVMSAAPAGQGSTMSLAGMELSPQRALFFVSMAIELLTLPFILLLREGAEMTADGLRITPAISKYPDKGMVESFRLTVRDAARETGRLLALLVKHPGFHRLLVFLLLIGVLKIVFNIMDAVLPTFAEREIGPEGGARVGRFNAVNSILILMLAPLVGMLTRRFSAYSMVIVGGFITALSFTFVALPASLFEGLANGPLGDWIGHGYLGLAGAVHPYFIMIVLWQVVFSFGEAFYSPRVYEYAASIAPKGQEASYAALSAVPLLMGKLITGAAFSGLLSAYCPATGPRDSGKMWTIVGLLVLVSPLALLLLQRFIRVKEEGRDS